MGASRRAGPSVSAITFSRRGDKREVDEESREELRERLKLFLNPPSERKKDVDKEKRKPRGDRGSPEDSLSGPSSGDTGDSDSESDSGSSSVEDPPPLSSSNVGGSIGRVRNENRKRKPNLRDGAIQFVFPCRCEMPGENIYDEQIFSSSSITRAPSAAAQASNGGKGGGKMSKGPKGLMTSDSYSADGHERKGRGIHFPHLGRRSLGMMSMRTSMSSKLSKTGSKLPAVSSETFSGGFLTVGGFTIIPSFHPACAAVVFVCEGQEYSGEIFQCSDVAGWGDESTASMSNGGNGGSSKVGKDGKGKGGSRGEILGDIRTRTGRNGNGGGRMNRPRELMMSMDMMATIKAGSAEDTGDVRSSSKDSAKSPDKAKKESKSPAPSSNGGAGDVRSSSKDSAKSPDKAKKESQRPGPSSNGGAGDVRSSSKDTAKSPDKAKKESQRPAPSSNGGADGSATQKVVVIPNHHPWCNGTELVPLAPKTPPNNQTVDGSAGGLEKKHPFTDGFPWKSCVLRRTCAVIRGPTSGAVDAGDYS